MQTNKTVLITGGNSGIGLGIAHQFAMAGMTLVLVGLPEQEDNLIAEFQTKYGIKAFYFQGNLASGAGCRAFIDQIKEKSLSIDILVNNAGMQYVESVVNFPHDKWEMILALNLSAAFYLSQAFLPHMHQQGYGRIVNIASAHGLVASKNKSAYVASKHGLIGLTKGIALEYAGSGVTCNAICPGWVLTPLVEKQIEAIADKENIDFESAKIKLLSEKQPSLEFVTPDQIGALAVFLTTEHASQMTGSAYSMDGGWTAV